MTALILVIILLLLLGVLGAVVKGLLWLTAIALLVIVGLAAYGWWKFRDTRRA